MIGARMLAVEADTYTFRHPLLGEVVYADMLPSERTRLHRRVAADLRRQPAEVLRRADRAGELAFHLDRGGDVAGAFTVLLAAADAAESVAPGAAFGDLERAFELWDAAGDASSGVSRSDRRWQMADLATSTVGNERAAQLARLCLGRRRSPARRRVGSRTSWAIPVVDRPAGGEPRRVRSGGGAAHR